MQNGLITLTPLHETPCPPVRGWRRMSHSPCGMERTLPWTCIVYSGWVRFPRSMRSRLTAKISPIFHRAGLPLPRMR
jgi:hypothetical protein